MKEYQKLELPKDSAWGRKTYDPVLRLYRIRDEWPKWVDFAFELWFIPRRFLLDIFSFFQRLMMWLPVIWKDRDWDDFFIFEIIKTKLITQRNYLIEKNRHMGIDAINRDITICLNLIERFQQSFYEIEIFDYYDCDIWFLETDETKKNKPSQKVYEMNKKMTRDNLLAYIDKYPLDRKRAIIKRKNLGLETPEDYRENPESRERIAIFMSEYRHQKCKSLLFSILSQKIEGWWD